MAPRLNMASVAGKQYRAMAALDSSITLDSRLRELVKIRASQLNGCAFCIDMHWKDARAAGESEERLYMLDAWRESGLYSDAEKAALELCEAVTMIAHSHVPDDVWARAAKHFADEELAQLVFAITAINAWNRIAITTRAEPGRHVPVAASSTTPGSTDQRYAHATTA